MKLLPEKHIQCSKWLLLILPQMVKIPCSFQASWSCLCCVHPNAQYDAVILALLLRQNNVKVCCLLWCLVLTFKKNQRRNFCVCVTKEISLLVFPPCRKRLINVPLWGTGLDLSHYSAFHFLCLKCWENPSEASFLLILNTYIGREEPRPLCFSFSAINKVFWISVRRTNGSRTWFTIKITRKTS